MAVPTIPVTNIDPAKACDGRTLGPAMLGEDPDRLRFHAGGGTQRSIFNRSKAGAEHTLAHFEVEDSETAVRALKADGVVFEAHRAGPQPAAAGIARLGPARGAWFHDPDGSRLGLRWGPLRRQART